MSKSKAIGTRRETWVVNRAKDAGFQARRAENNAKSKDVLITVAGRDVPHEVKDVAALSIHPILATAVETNGPDAAVVWHRKTKSKAGTKRVPAGPTLVAVTFDRYLQLLGFEEAAGA
ncbi:MAG: hypothetical protein RLY50_37 [Actinomycetota bacterium]